MLKNILMYLGLRNTRNPALKYAAMSRFGFVPIAAYVAWQNRERILSFVRRARGGNVGAIGQGKSQGFGAYEGTSAAV